MDVKHGTLSGYTNGRCRCEECRAAKLDYEREYRRKAGPPSRPQSEHARRRGALRELLMELCPDGLTDDCPARRKGAAA